jgi:isopentenyl-diphosphate delta-isomerase type 1
MSANEYVVLVDANDNEIGIEEKLLAHQQAKLHRAFSIFIVRYNSDHQLQILLQQRQTNKYHSAGLWTNTCCSHPMPGESILRAGQRRLHEEMGISTDLCEIASFQYKAAVGADLIEHEFDHVLVGTYAGEDIPFNRAEVADARWVDVRWLQEDLHLHPEKYTAWFAEALELVLAKISNLFPSPTGGEG